MIHVWSVGPWEATKRFSFCPDCGVTRIERERQTKPNVHGVPEHRLQVVYEAPVRLGGLVMNGEPPCNNLARKNRLLKAQALARATEIKR